MGQGSLQASTTCPLSSQTTFRSFRLTILESLACSPPIFRQDRRWNSITPAMWAVRCGNLFRGLRPTSWSLGRGCRLCCRTRALSPLRTTPFTFMGMISTSLRKGSVISTLRRIQQSSTLLIHLWGTLWLCLSTDGQLSDLLLITQVKIPYIMDLILIVLV